MDDEENDQYEDLYNELDHEEIDNLLVPYSEEEEEDPLRRTELSEQEKNLFKQLPPEEPEDDDLTDELNVTFDESQNTTKLIPNRNESNDFAEKEENNALDTPTTEETLLTDTAATDTGTRPKRNVTKHDYAKMNKQGVSLIFSYLCQNYQ